MEESPNSPFLELEVSRDEWVRRRNEYFTFDTAQDLDWRVEIEYWREHSVETEFGQVTPIANIARSPSRHVAVSSANGPLAILRRPEERALWAQAFLEDTRLAAETSAQLGVSPAVLNEVVHFLIDDHAIIGDSSNIPLSELRRYATTLRETDPSLSLVLSEVAQRRTVCLVRTEPSSAETRALANVEMRMSASYPLRRATLRRAYRAVRNSADPNASEYARWRNWSGDGRSALVTLADGAAMTHLTTYGTRADERFRAAWKWPWWVQDTYVMDVFIDGFNEYASLHLFVSVPAGVYIDSAILRVHSEDHDPGSPETIGGDSHPVRSEILLAFDDEQRLDQAHIHLPYLPYPADLDRVYWPPRLRIVVRPTYHDGLRSGLVLSLISSVVLAVLLATVAWQEAGWDPVAFVSFNRSNIDVNSIVSLVLLAPTVALTLMIRMNEHGLTKVVHSRYRVRLAAVAVSLFFGAIWFAIGVAGEALAWCIIVSLVITLGSTSFTLWSALVSGYRAHKLHDRERGAFRAAYGRPPDEY